MWWLPQGEKPAGDAPTQRPWYQAVDTKKATLTKVRRTSEGNLVVLLIARVLATWMATRISAPWKSLATGNRQTAEGDADLLAHAESGAEDMTSLEESTRALYESSERISEVVPPTTAIGAAPAGDAGKGFAVAEEIRKLAEQSSLAAQEIRNTVQEILGLVQANGEKTDRGRQGFTKVRVRVSTVSELGTQIATADITTVSADLKVVADDIQREFSRFVTTSS